MKVDIVVVFLAILALASEAREFSKKTNKYRTLSSISPQFLPLRSVTMPIALNSTALLD
jgi:hypothetical protein